MKKISFILFMLMCVAFLSCKQSGRYGKIPQERASRFLYARTEMPWFGNMIEVQELVEKKADIEYIDSSKTAYTTPFLNAAGALACLQGKDQRRKGELDSMEMEAVKIVKYLATKGANVHALDVSGRNALHLAAKGGRDKMIPVLVELGLDINLRDTSIMTATPLVLAIISGDLATVKAIVEAGANINLILARGNTSLDYAIGLSKANSWNYSYHDQQAIADYLISIGAKPGKNNFKNWLQF